MTVKTLAGQPARAMVSPVVTSTGSVAALIPAID